jgi:hypothetical protein
LAQVLTGPAVRSLLRHGAQKHHFVPGGWAARSFILLVCTVRESPDCNVVPHGKRLSLVLLRTRVSLDWPQKNLIEDISLLMLPLQFPAWTLRCRSPDNAIRKKEETQRNTFEVLHMPQKMTMEVSKVLRLPRKLQLIF